MDRGLIKLVEWIARYWLEVLFGLICAGFGLFFKNYIKLLKKQREDDKKAMQDELRKEMREGKEEWLAADIGIKESFKGEIKMLDDRMNALTKGMLSVQGRQFRLVCRSLLASDHVITLEEFEEFEDDYAAYKGLGGNHTGDALHESVVEKFHNQSIGI